MSERNKIRQQIRNRRKMLSQQQQLQAGMALAQQIAIHPLIPQARRVAIYLANDGELDTSAAIQWFWTNNIAVCLPILHPFSPGHLLFMDYDADTSMRANRFGIMEPSLACHRIVHKKEIDIIFTPLVAFDSSGNRLGMGGGFYDRTLKQWQQHKLGAYPIGIAHDCQEYLAIPTEEWDVPLPELLTPSRRLHWAI